MANTPNLNQTLPVGESDSQKVGFYNAFDQTLDAAVAGLLTLSVAGNSDITLTNGQAMNPVMIFTGALTGSINLIIPALGSPTGGRSRLIVVYNSTSGAFTLTIKIAGGTGIAVTQGKRRLLYHDGVNVYDAITESGAGSGTTNTIPKWTSATGLGNSALTDDGAKIKATLPLAVTVTSAIGTAAAVDITSIVQAGNVAPYTPTQSATLNATTTPVAGNHLYIVLTTSGVSSFTITFGTNFKSTGTLATGTVSGKVFVIHFISDSVNFNEVSRTVAM